MLESQKLSFQEFMLGYKHGIYVLTSDTCDICHKYKKTIEHINNANLYFVDVVTREEMDYAYKLLQRGSFPLTACFWENQLEYVRLGQLFDLQLEEIFASLKKFGDKPLTKEEKEQRLKAIRTRCELSYYVFPPDITDDKREILLNKAIDNNELPIDIERICPTLEPDKRFHLFEGNLPFAKLVIYKDENTNIFNPFAQRVIMAYTTRVKDAKFIIRKVEDELNASDNPNK